MAVKYFDPDGGNDANDGLSFANRKKSWNAVSFAAGDELRIIAAPDPISLGSVSWTNGSNTLTLPAAKTLTVDNCDTAWTPSTNVTATAITANTSFTSSLTHPYKEGTGRAHIVAASAFATGIIAYRALPSTLNLSGYTALSLYFGNSVAIVANGLRLDLCSDAVGAVPVASYTFPADSTTGTVRAMLLEFGSALPSNVNSIALYALLDPGVNAAFALDNIIACQSKGHADHFCHDSLIGKQTTGEPEWWPIRSIDGTTVVLGDLLSTPSSAGRLYPGATETVTTYAQQTQRLLASGLVTANNVKFNISGGWDRTAMTTQTGRSVLTGYGFVATPFRATSPAFTITGGIGIAGFQSGILGHQTLTGTCDAHVDFVVGCATVCGSLENYRVIDIGTAIMCDAFGSNSGSNIWNTRVLVDIDLYGESRTTSGLFTSATDFGPNSPPTQADFRVGMFRNNATVFGDGQGSIYVRGAQLVANTNDFGDVSTNRLNTVLIGCSFQRAPDSGTISNGSVVYTGRNGDPRLCGYFNYLISCEVQTTVVPATGDTAAWAFEFRTNDVVAATPLYYPISRFAVEAGKTYTIGYDGRYASTNTLGRVRVVDTDRTEYGATMAGGANAWATYSFNFTADADGYVEIELGGYGSANNSVYAANFTIAVS